MARMPNSMAYGLFGLTRVDRDDGAAREFAALAQAGDAAAPPAPAPAPAPAAAMSPWILIGVAGVALAIYLVAGDDDGAELSEWDEYEDEE